MIGTLKPLNTVSMSLILIINWFKVIKLNNDILIPEGECYSSYSLNLGTRLLR